MKILSIFQYAMGGLTASSKHLYSICDHLMEKNVSSFLCVPEIMHFISSEFRLQKESYALYINCIVVQ